MVSRETPGTAADRFLGAVMALALAIGFCLAIAALLAPGPFSSAPGA